MKVLIDLTPLADNFSGLERFSMCITKELLSYTDKEYILVFKNNIHPNFIDVKTMKNVEVVILKGGNKMLFNQVKLPWNIYKLSADVYLFLSFPSPWLLFKKNVISAIHDIVCWDCPDTMKLSSEIYFKISFLLVSRFCSHIITVSKFSKERIIDKLGVDSKKIWLIYDGLSEAFGNNEYDKEVIKKYALPTKYILSLSTIEPRKNLGLLLKAYEFLWKNNEIDMDLVLAGRKGWKVDKIVDDLSEDVIEHIHFTGYIEDEDLPSIYHFANLFVYPSMYEGFGIPPLEAMACRTPVITSNAASLPEVCADGAVYFENNDLESLKTTIKNFLNKNKEYRDNCVKAGVRRSKKFSWKEEARKLNNYLDSLNLL